MFGPFREDRKEPAIIAEMTAKKAVPNWQICAEIVCNYGGHGEYKPRFSAEAAWVNTA
jgi:hypothetical protein